MRIEAAAEQFLRNLVVERGCSSLTAVAYQSDMRKLVEYLEQVGIEAEVEGLTPIVLRRYVSFLAGNGYNPATHRAAGSLRPSGPNGAVQSTAR